MPDVSPKAARILDAARELLLRHGVKGVSVAEIAQRAHVGKGTVYLYWETKEDLYIEVFTRDFLAMTDTFAEPLATDPDLARPQQLFLRIVTTTMHHPFAMALHLGDADWLGVLTEHPRSRELLESHGPDAMAGKVLPVLREHGLVHTDWTLDEQTTALRALMIGFFELAVKCAPEELGPLETVMAKTVTAVLGAPDATEEQLRATAATGLEILRDSRAAMLDVITATST